ncbi:hypothetical protein AB0K09_17340 [Streptomyces sp. NPDC049577]|uniref:hypothetical protein n=1 Tax=Streptomyces sp. NPDC049577 TaxID=3155153 RepID=UPI00344A3DCE
MPKTVKHVTAPVSQHITEDAPSLAELRRDCARMAPHWRGAPAGVPAGRTPLDLIHGVVVPVTSARLLDGMSEYGD